MAVVGGILRGPPTLSLRSETDVTSTPNITIPSGSQVGDLAIYMQRAFESFGTITKVIPSGFTEITGMSKNNNSTALYVSYRILTSSDPSRVITGMNQDDETAELLIFSGNIIGVEVKDADSEQTDGNPSAQTVTSGSGRAPLIVLGAVVEETDPSDPPFSTASPAFDNTYVPSGSSNFRVGYKIYNSAPVNHTIDTDDLGDNTILASCYIQVF